MDDSAKREQKELIHDEACGSARTACNNVVQETVRELEHTYKKKTDEEIIMSIRMGNHAGEALFYLLFGRYVEMLRVIFIQQSKPSMEFDDFMLELDIRLFARHCAAVSAFNGQRATFKTYLSKIAHHLLYDMREKDIPMLDVDAVECSAGGPDQYEVFMLVDAINSYPNWDSRFVLLKTIEGYKSKEIAEMLTSRRHEKGTLETDKQLLPSYVDTIRSRALKDIRRHVSIQEDKNVNACMECPPSLFDGDALFSRLARKLTSRAEKKTMPTSRNVVMPDMYAESLFIKNIFELYNQMKEE